MPSKHLPQYNLPLPLLGQTLLGAICSTSQQLTRKMALPYVLSAGIDNVMYYRRGRKEQASIKTCVYALTKSFGPTKGSPITALCVLRAELQICQELGIPLAYDRLELRVIASATCIAPICCELATRFHSSFGSEGSTGLQSDLNLPDQPDDAGPSMLEVVAKIISSQPNTEWSTAPQYGGAAGFPSSITGLNGRY